MLSGRRAYASDSNAGTLARVLEREPDWQALPDETPSAVRSLLMRCLRKDPRQRLRDIGDARLTIEESLAASIDAPVVRAARQWRMKPLLAMALVALAAIAVTYWLTKVAADARPTRDMPAFDRVVRFVASAAHEFSPAISPDREMGCLSVERRRTRVPDRSLRTGALQKTHRSACRRVPPRRQLDSRRFLDRVWAVEGDGGHHPRGAFAVRNAPRMMHADSSCRLSGRASQRRELRNHCADRFQLAPVWSTNSRLLISKP
jgi:hypothetical protein